MRRVSMFIFLTSLLLTIFYTRPLWAVTYAYIPSYDNDKVVAVATSTGEFTSVTISADNSCGPYGVAAIPNGRFVVVSCAKSGELAVAYRTDFSDESDLLPEEQIISTDLVNIPRGVAFEPEGQYVYIVNDNGDTTNGSVIRVGAGDPTDEDDMAEVNVGRGPKGIAAIRVSGENGDTFKAYVANYMDGSISVLSDDGTEITAATITGVGTNPVGVAASPDGRYVYVTNYNGGSTGSLAVIQTSTDTVVNRINVGNGAWGVAVGSFGDIVYVTNSAANTVSVIDAVNRTVFSTNAVGTQPYGITAAKNGNFAYAYNASGINPISRINVSNGSVTVESIAQNGDHPILTPYALGVGITGTPPAAPSGLEGISNSYTEIELNWVYNGSDALGFKIERREEEDTDYIEIARVDADVKTYADRSVASGTTYIYRIRAYNEAADSAYATMSEDDAVTTEDGGFSWCFIGTLLD